MTVVDLATQIGRYSLLLLWAALLIRARPAWREHYQRGLWLAILTAAIATTLFQPEITRWAIDVTDDAPAVILSRNLCGVVSAGLTLLFIVDSTRGRQPRLVITVGLVATVACLVGMDLARDGYPGPGGPRIPLTGGPAVPSAAYWVLLCAAHLLTDVVAVIVCERHSRRTRDRDLVWSLRLFAIGSILAIVFWAAYLLNLYVRIPHALPYLAVVINVHAFSRALTLLVPTLNRAVRLTRDARTVWLLWPMWHDLFAAVPSVALVQPQPTRLHQILRPRTPLALQAHRQTIETYDAILGLQSHVRPQAYEAALQHAHRTRIPASRTAAAALAGAPWAKHAAPNSPANHQPPHARYRAWTKATRRCCWRSPETGQPCPTPCPAATPPTPPRSPRPRCRSDRLPHWEAIVSLHPVRTSRFGPSTRPLTAQPPRAYPRQKDDPLHDHRSDHRRHLRHRPGLRPPLRHRRP